jgi:hypothetical protein
MVLGDVFFQVRGQEKWIDGILNVQRNRSFWFGWSYFHFIKKSGFFALL